MTSPNYAENNSVENIETKISNMISRLKKRNMQGPLDCALEFPLSFVKVHATNFRVLATFQPTKCDQTWPIKVTVKEDPTPKHRVFAFGPGGWKAFMVDNDIQVSDTLVFSLVGYSHFMVDIIKAPLTKKVDEYDPSLNPFPFMQNIEEASMPCKRCRKVPPQDGPWFVVNVAPQKSITWLFHSTFGSALATWCKAKSYN